MIREEYKNNKPRSVLRKINDYNASELTNPLVHEMRNTAKNLGKLYSILNEQNKL